MKQRPGKFRRWLLRPAMWCIAVVVVLLFALFVFLQSDFLREYLRAQLVIALEGILDREVEVDSLDFQLLPLWVELRGVEIGGPTPDEPPIAELGRLFVEAEILGWRQPVISLRQVRIEEPYIRLEFFEEGGRNWPTFRRDGDEPKARSERRRMPPVRIGVDYLSLERGTIELDHMRMPLELSARSVQGFMSGSPETVLHGRIAAQQVSVNLPRARPFLGAVGLKIAVSPDGVELAGGRVSGPHLTAGIQGHAGWGDDREITVSVQASGSSEFFRHLGYLEDQIQGPFTFQGGVVWRPRNWDFEGDVTSPSLVIFNRHVHDIAVIARGSNEGIRIEVQSAHYGEGTLTGAVIYDHDAEGRPFEVDLALAGVDLQQIVDDQELPVRGLAGRVDGVFDYRFPMGDSRNGEGWADLKITPREDVPDGFPVSGSVPLTIEGGVIRAAAGRITSGAHRIGAEGFYDLETRAGRFDYEIATDDLEQILKLMPILEEGEPLPLWYPTEGTGEVIGTLVLEPGDTRTDLQLSLDYALAKGVRAQQVQASMAIGGDGVERLRVELTQPDAGLLVTGSIPFGADEESAEPPVPFKLAVDAASWPLDQALSWLPFEVPLDGRVSGSLVLSGQIEALVGELRARLEPAVVAGIECGALRLDLDFDPKRLVFHSGVLESDAGEVVLRGDIDQITEALNLVVEASALDLSQPPFSNFATEPLTGQLAARAVIEGSLSSPRLDGELLWSGLAVREQLIGDEGRAETRLAWDGGELRLDGDLFGLVSITGGGRLDSKEVDLRFSVEGRDLHSLAQLTSEEEIPDFAGGFSGELLMTGLPNTDEPWSKVLRLDRFATEYAGQRLENLEPVVVRLDVDGLRIESFFVADVDGLSELFVAGLIGSDEARSLDLRLMSSLESKWFDLIMPELGLREGSFDVLATVGGSLEGPELNGQGVIREARVVSTLLPHSLEQMGGVILFYPQQIVVDRLEAKMAGGEVLASGKVTPADEPGDFDYRFQVVGRDLSVRFPEDWLSRGDAELVLASTPEGRQVRGLVTLDGAFYSQDVGLSMGQMMQGFFAPRRIEVETANELLTTTHLNITIVGPGALRVRNNLADLRGDIDLVVRGTAARPILFGEVELDQESVLVYGGNDYKIEQGRLNFANPFQIEPVIDVVATTRVREYDVTLSLSGSLERLNASFSSDPPLADLEVLTLLTTGEERLGSSRSTGSEEQGAALRATSLLYGQASSLVSERANRLFGLEQFRIEPLTNSTGEPSSARVTVGEQLSRDLFATYSIDPTTNEQWILQLEWAVSRSMTLVLTQNGDDSYSADVRWQKSF